MISKNEIILLAGILTLIVVLLTGIFYPVVSYSSITGLVAGEVNITVKGTAGFTLNSASINFSNGYYNESCTLDYAYLGVDASRRESTKCWVNLSTYSGSLYHVVNNSGTTILNITFDLSVNDAETFYCGASGCPLTNNSKIQALVSDDLRENGSCASVSYIENSYVTLLSATAKNTSHVLCNYLDYENTNDEIDIMFNFSIPKDVSSGQKSFQITYIATAIQG
jgi:hypothetical protein